MSWYNITEVIAAGFAFGLPFTLLMPGFSVWNIIPKVGVERFHIVSQELTWPQINTAVISLLVCFFSLYLEIRKRSLDDIVEKVLSVTTATETTLEGENNRRAAAVRVYVELLDASAEHYENLMLLRDGLSKVSRIKQQHPPAVELSTSPSSLEPNRLAISN